MANLNAILIGQARSTGRSSSRHFLRREYLWTRKSIEVQQIAVILLVDNVPTPVPTTHLFNLPKHPMPSSESLRCHMQLILSLRYVRSRKYIIRLGPTSVPQPAQDSFSASSNSATSCNEPRRHQLRPLDLTTRSLTTTLDRH